MLTYHYLSGTLVERHNLTAMGNNDLALTMLDDEVTKCKECGKFIRIEDLAIAWARRSEGPGGSPMTFIDYHHMDCAQYWMGPAVEALLEEVLGD
jgi:hypothetical protein